jgi:hypothetical protein
LLIDRIVPKIRKGQRMMDMIQFRKATSTADVGQWPPSKETNTMEAPMVSKVRR